jgi:N-methylhydantoinase A
VLGYINPVAIADGTLPIDRSGALSVIDDVIGRPLGLTAVEAAKGIITIANAVMTRALRAVSTERGRDLRGSALIAFGGSGPLHAASICQSVGVTKIIVPPISGVLSALGLLLAGDRLDYIQSIGLPLAGVHAAMLQNTYDAMERQARGDLSDSGQVAKDLSFECSLDVRYRYEPTELNLALDLKAPFDRPSLEERFKEAREREYGFRGDGDLYVARMRLRLKSAGYRPPPGGASNDSGTHSPDEEQSRDAYFATLDGPSRTGILLRSDVERYRPVEGPLIIQEPTTTILVPPGWTIHRDELDNLILERPE